MSNTRKLMLVPILAIGVVFAGWAQGPSPETKMGTLQTGQSACTRVFYSQGPAVELKGDVTSKPKVPVTWRLERSKDKSGTFNTLVVAGARTIDTEILQSQQPNKFPGYFKACVEDDTSFAVNYTLSIGADTD